MMYLKAVLDFIWDILVTIIRHPLFWLIVTCFFIWTIAQTPAIESEVCPTCQQILKR